MQPHLVESQEHAECFGRSRFKCQGQDTTLVLVLSFTLYYFQPNFQPAGISEAEGQILANQLTLFQPEGQIMPPSRF